MAAAVSPRPAPDETTHLFVYGGLMRGFDLHHHLAGASFVDDAWTPGALVALGRYPGFIDGEGKVFGEVYRLGDPPADLEALDDLEDFDPANPASSIYVRVVREVYLSDSKSLPAWVYVYNKDVNGLTKVAGGDWRRR